MDLYCPRCGEPWDLDSLHEETTARRPDAPWRTSGNRDRPAYTAYFEEVLADFAERGCEALGSFAAEHQAATLDGPRAAASATLFQLLGTDVDAIAALSEDLHLVDL